MKKTWQIIMMLLLVLPFVGKAQEEGYLYENFNKLTMQTLPPYGWRMIDADGDGSLWAVAGDGVDGSLAMTSYINFLFSPPTKPDNWLVTPPLSVEKATDSISYWIGSYKGQSNYMEIWVARKNHDLESFTVRIDSVTFDGSDETKDHYFRSICLKEFLGDTVYVGFRYLYKASLPNIDNTIGIALDNIRGPKVVPYKTELSVDEILLFGGASVPCDIEDEAMTVVLANKGSLPVSDFDIYCQSYGFKENGDQSMSSILSGRVERTLNPGDTLHYTFAEKLPFSLYQNEHNTLVGVRAFIGLEADEWENNDTLIQGYYKQISFEPPMEVNFEQEGGSEHSSVEGWYISYRPESQAIAPFSIGENPQFAHVGNNYLTCGIYPPYSGEATNGEDAFAATRCMQFVQGEKYRIDMFYAFRKMPAEWEKQELHFRVILGKEQHDLPNTDHIVVIDTVLKRAEALVSFESAVYTLFSSAEFSVEETGAYYVGLVFYSDVMVEEQTDSWMIFVDDFALRNALDEVPIDLSLEDIILPYDCNLTEAEEVSFVVRNNSVKDISNVKVSYKINNKDEVSETIEEPIPATGSLVYTFTKKADFSEFRRYRVDGLLEYERDSTVANNEKTEVTENTSVLELPYADDFENYSTTLNFEDEWLVYSKGYYTWGAAFDYSADTVYAYNGIGFLADAFGDEQYVAQDDWMVSRCLAFKKDSTYKISFAYRIEMAGTGKSSLGAYILASYDTASKVQEVAKLSDIRNTEYAVYTMDYKADKDFNGHFAFHSTSELKAPIIMIDALRVGEMPINVANRTHENARIAIYPNPARDIVNINAGSIDMSRIELYNLSGQKVMSRNVDGNRCSLNVGGYTPGMYLLRATDKSGKVYNGRFIIGK